MNDLEMLTNKKIFTVVETSAHQEEFYFKFDFFIFLLQYSFLFSNKDTTQKTCTLKTNHFLVSQGNGEKGARYLDPKYSRWISVDPALGEYVPQAPVNDEAKKHNQNLPGLGGIFNSVNLNLYHYAANNPIKYTDPDGKFDWESFKQNFITDLKAATNLDFGIDYYLYATDSWNNKNYFSWATCTISFYCEATYDTLFAYGGAKVLDAAVKAISMLGTTLAALSSSSTVVLGKYNSGVCGGYTKMADKIGAKYFQIPDLMYKALDKINLGEKLNSAWLNGVMKSGARILLNSDPYKALETNTAYGMEIRALQDSGYKFISTIEQGIECWEAIKQ